MATGAKYAIGRGADLVGEGWLCITSSMVRMAGATSLAIFFWYAADAMI